MPRVCNGCLAASVDAVDGTAPGPDTIHDPATCELVPPIAPTADVCPECGRPAGDPQPHKLGCGRRSDAGLTLSADRSAR
jgi:hypothetical protein